MAHEDADSLSRRLHITHSKQCCYCCCGFYTSLNSFEGGSSLVGGNLCTYLLVDGVADVVSLVKKIGWQIVPKYVDRWILFLAINKSRIVISIHTCVCFFTYLIDKNQAFVCFKQNIFIRSDTLLPLFWAKMKNDIFPVVFTIMKCVHASFFFPKKRMQNIDDVTNFIYGRKKYQSIDTQVQ